MTSSRLLALALALPLFAGCAAPTDEDASGTHQAATVVPITLENWTTHAKIVEVTTMVERLDKARADKETVETQTNGELCKGFGEKTRSWSLLPDGSGDYDQRIVRFEGDLGDVKTTRSVYYDPSSTNAATDDVWFARVRFVSERQEAVIRGGAREQRAYFGADGAWIWEVSRDVSAAGVPGPWRVVDSRHKLARQSEFPEHDRVDGNKNGFRPECLTADEAAKRIRDASIPQP
jgi:hypothetical protein